MPAPVRATFCGLPTALSEMISDELRVPVNAGLNVTLIAQFAPGDNEVPQVEVCEKSPGSDPKIEIALMLKVVVPTLVRLTDSAAEDKPTATVPKFKLVADSFAAVPVPVSGSVCGLPTAVSVMLRFAVRAPLAVGLNVTVMVQFAFAANKLPHEWV